MTQLRQLQPRLSTSKNLSIEYKQRNKVERLFNKIKQFRRVATRYEKLKANFLAFVILALIVIMLR